MNNETLSVIIAALLLGAVLAIVPPRRLAHDDYPAIRQSGSKCYMLVTGKRYCEDENATH